MTKTAKKSVIDSNQLTLFDLLKQEQIERTESAPGRLCISARLQAAIKHAVKQAPMSRETLADTMSVLTGRTVTIHMIANWIAESHPHHIPAELIPALCSATGCNDPLQVQIDAAGLFALAGPDALRADMQKDVEQKRAIDRRIRQKEALIKALEVVR